MLKEQFESFGSHSPVMGAFRPNEIELFEKHFALLKEWNVHMGLVSRKSIDKSAASHYMDSIRIVDFAEKLRDGNSSVFDLGSGAGFPGVIYGIRYPKTKVLLFERMLKKQSFLAAVLAQLDMPNVTLAGEFPTSNIKGLVIGRAVLPPAELFSFMGKRLSPGSKLVVNLGGKTEPITPPKEFRLLDEVSYELPLDCGGRKAQGYTYVPRGT